MQLRSLAAGTLLVSLTIPGLALTRVHHGPKSQRSLTKRATHRAAAKATGQRSIEDSRASEIQQALAGAGYLSEEPTGHWDAETQSAMQRYQADHGWQTKMIPDSRAIIKLGLGPHAPADGASETTVAQAQ